MAIHSSFLGFDITAIHQTGSILFGHSERNDANSDLDQMRQSRGLDEAYIIIQMTGAVNSLDCTFDDIGIPNLIPFSFS